MLISQIFAGENGEEKFIRNMCLQYGVNVSTAVRYIVDRQKPLVSGFVVIECRRRAMTLH